MNDKALFKLSYGLFVLTANKDGKDNGCIINTVCQVTDNPKQISITVNKDNLTHDMIKDTSKFTVSVIAENASFDLFKRFGFASGRDTDKFAGFDGAKTAGNGTKIVTEGTNAYILAWVTDTVDLGTHTMFIATVTDMEILSDIPSATYAYYHAHIKPQPTANKSDKKVWKCRICGYEYDGEDLPEDFICPLCKHPASDFELV